MTHHKCISFGFQKAEFNNVYQAIEICPVKANTLADTQIQGNRLIF